jgi:hypothetical protein
MGCRVVGEVFLGQEVRRTISLVEGRQVLMRVLYGKAVADCSSCWSGFETFVPRRIPRQHLPSKPSVGLLSSKRNTRLEAPLAC